MKEQWAKYDISEITLSPVADGFEGTAKDSKGETFKIKLKKDPAKKSVSGTGVGDRGTELDYSGVRQVSRFGLSSHFLSSNFLSDRRSDKKLVNKT